MDRTIQAMGSTLVGTMVAFLGGADALLSVFLVIVFLDMLTGILKALYAGEYKSARFREGLYRKLAYFIAIVLVVQLDKLTANSGMFRSILITFLVCNEMISIIENLGTMGVPFPSKITEAIEVLKNKDNDRTE